MGSGGVASLTTGTRLASLRDELGHTSPRIGERPSEVSWRHPTAGWRGLVDAGGITACSRWLSEATPPDTDPPKESRASRRDASNSPCCAPC